MACLAVLCGQQPDDNQRGTVDFVEAASILKNIDEQWLENIVQSNDYCVFRNGELELTDETALRYGMLALADSLTSEPQWNLIAKAWLFDSNPYSAAAFYNAMQTHMGNPSQGHYRVANALFRHRNRNIAEIEAAMFAIIWDEGTFYTYTRHLAFLGPSKVRAERNMFVALARKLRYRNQPYMNNEWKRLWGFTKNLHIKGHAFLCVRDVDIPEATQFSLLVSEIRSLHDRLAKNKIDLATTERCDKRSENFEAREFDLSGISCAQAYFYSIPSLIDPYCERLTNRKDLKTGRVRLSAKANDLDGVARVIDAVRNREKMTVAFSENRVAIVYPTDILSDKLRQRRFFFLQGVIGRTAIVIPQNVFVVHTVSGNAKSAIRILDAVQNDADAIVPWSDGTSVALWKSPINWSELGGKEFVVKHMPNDEDFRYLEWKGNGDYLLLKASPKGIDHIRRLTLNDLSR